MQFIDIILQLLTEFTSYLYTRLLERIFPHYSHRFHEIAGIILSLLVFIGIIALAVVGLDMWLIDANTFGLCLLVTSLVLFVAQIIVDIVLYVRNR